MADDGSERPGNPLEEHHWRLRALEQEVFAGPRPGVRTWLDKDLTEPAVQVALRDLVRSGECAFDVGANFGGLSMLMSRLAGPRGQVCAFEANASIARECQQFLVGCGCGNVQLYNNAVYHSSMQPLQMFVSGNRVSDSLYNRVSDQTVTVISLALDDFVEQTGLRPSLVKMDIEGAEYDALLGFEKTVAETRPTLVLEQQTTDERCLAWLLQRDYVAIDLYEFVPITSFGDLTRGAEGTDILYMPRERIGATPYSPPFRFDLVAQLRGEDFRWHNDHVYATSRPLQVSAGRYRVVADFKAEDPQAELKTGVAEGTTPLMRYHGTSGWLARTGSHWIFHLPRPMEVSLFFEFPSRVDPTFALKEVRVERIPQFDSAKPRPWV